MSLSELILRTIATALNITTPTTQEVDENSAITAIANVAKVNIGGQTKKPLAGNKTFSRNEIETLGEELLNIAQQSFENIKLITSQNEAKAKLTEFMKAWRMLNNLIYALPDEYYETVNTPHLEDTILGLKRQLTLTNILYHAAKQNNIALIEVVLEYITLGSHNPQKLINGECPQPNQETDYDAPLHIAVRSNQTSATEALLSNPFVNVNCQNSYGDSALHIAVSTNNLPLAETLLAHGKIELNIKNRDGNTPLHVATQKGHTVMVALLLNAGVQIDCWNEDGNRPLHLAVLEKHEPIISLLKEKKAPESENKAGKKPSDYYKPQPQEHLPTTNCKQEAGTPSSLSSAQPSLVLNPF